MAEQDLRVQLRPFGLKSVIDALRQVKGEANRTAKDTTSVFGRLRAGISRSFSRDFGSLIPTVGFVAASTAIIGLVKHVTDFSDQMGEAATRVGSSVENFSAMSFGARMAGVEVEQFERSLLRAARSVSEFRQGGGAAAETFTELGLSARDFAGKDTVESFELIARKIGALPAGMDKTRAAFELLGRAGARNIPLLNDIAQKGFAQIRAEAESLGALVRGETAEAAAQFNDNMDRIKIAGAGVAKSFINPFLPALTEVARAIAEAAKQGGILTGIWVGLGGAAAVALGKTDAQTRQNQLEEATQQIAELEAQYEKTQATLARGTLEPVKLLGVSITPEVQLNEGALNSLRKNAFDLTFQLDQARRKHAELIAQDAKANAKPTSGDADGIGTFDVQKRIAELTKQVGGEQLKQLDSIQKKRDTIAQLEVQNAQRIAETKATTQTQIDRIEVDALTRREQLIRQSFQNEIQAAQVKEQALAAVAARTTPKGRTATELQAAIARQSFDDQLKAATTYYQKLSQLQEQYVARHKQSQDRIKAIDQEVVASRLAREQIIANAARAGLSEEEKNNADLKRMADARAELGNAVLRGAGDEARKLNAEVNELFARLASAPGFENAARKISDSAQGIFETLLEVEKQREQALGKEAAEKIRQTNTELEKTKKIGDDLAKQSAIEIKPTVDQQAIADLRKRLQESLEEKPFRINVVPQIGSGSTQIQQLAEGGAVAGVSPGPRADDKLVRATSGEFMHPVAAVKHYGLKFMEMIRARKLPTYADGGPIQDERNVLGSPKRKALDENEVERRSFATGFWRGLGSAADIYPSPVRARRAVDQTEIERSASDIRETTRARSDRSVADQSDVTSRSRKASDESEIVRRAWSVANASVSEAQRVERSRDVTDNAMIKSNRAAIYTDTVKRDRIATSESASSEVASIQLELDRADYYAKHAERMRYELAQAERIVRTRSVNDDEFSASRRESIDHERDSAISTSTDYKSAESRSEEEATRATRMRTDASDTERTARQRSEVDDSERIRRSVEREELEKRKRTRHLTDLIAGGIPQRASGGQIPGVAPHAKADNVLMLGTSGEYVHNVAAVRHYGLDFMRAVNERRLDVPKFALGGLVNDVRTIQNVVPFAPVQRFADGGLVREIERTAKEQSRDVVDVNLTLGGDTVRVSSDRDEARRLVRMFQNLDRGATR